MSANVVRHPLTKYRDSRIMGTSWQWITDPLQDWTAEGKGMAALAWDLVQTDPYCASMLAARLTLTHGDKGLRFRSTYQTDENPNSTDAERQAQRTLTGRIAQTWHGTWVDAGRQMTRAQVERQIDTNQIVTGDGFAVRCFLPDRQAAPYATAWRVVAPERIRNPKGIDNWYNPGKPDIGEPAPKSHIIWEGIELDQQKQPVAIWIENPSRNPRAPMECTYTRVPYWADNGTQNVIHKFKQIRAGQLRGFSEFLPVFVHAAQLYGVSEAHVVGKRTQACNTMLIRSSDPEVAARFARAGAIYGPHTQDVPGLKAYVGEDAEVINQSMSYNGADFRDFVDSILRPMSAAWGLPWQFVMAQLTNANLASSRAALDQAERTASHWQDIHIETCTGIIDRSYLAEDIARRRFPYKSIDRICKGRYLRPRTWSTDRAKESVAAKNWNELGKSLTTIFAEQGMDFEDEVRQKAQDNAFLAAQGVEIGELMPVPEEPEEPEENKDEEDIEETQEIEVDDED